MNELFCPGWSSVPYVDGWQFAGEHLVDDDAEGIYICGL